MTGGDPLREGQVLTGPLFSEPMRVETVTATGPAAWTLGLVGLRTERFHRVALTKDQLLPKLRTGTGLEVSVGFEVEVDAATAGQLVAELRQILADLAPAERVRIDE